MAKIGQYVKQDSWLPNNSAENKLDGETIYAQITNNDMCVYLGKGNILCLTCYRNIVENLCICVEVLAFSQNTADVII